MNTPKQPVRLTERQRTILEMRSHGIGLHATASALEIGLDDVFWALDGAADLLGATSAVHLIAIAIRGGHIL